MYTWCVTVHRHPNLSPLRANLDRIETIKRELIEFGFLIHTEHSRRSRFWICHSSKHALLHYTLAHGEIAYASVEDVLVEMP